MKERMHIVKQMNEKDCGPACLLSILQHYKGYVPLEKIREDSKTDTTGTTAYNLMKAANTYGLDSKGVSLKKDKLLSTEIIYPAIFHIYSSKQSHFVVVYKVNKSHILLMDPGRGKVKLELEDFLFDWTGNIIEFYPRSKLTLMNKENKILPIIIDVISLEKRLILKIIVISLIIVLHSIGLSYYFKTVIENINMDNNFLVYLILIFGMFTLIKVILTFIRLELVTYFNKNMDVYLFREFFDHLFSLPSNTLQRKSVGEIITRITDLGGLKTFFSEVIITFLLDFLLMLIAIPVLINIESRLFVIILISIIFHMITGFIFSKILSCKILDNKVIETNFNTVVVEYINMFGSIKNLSKSENVLNDIEKKLVLYLKGSFNIEKINNIQNNIKTFVDEFMFFSVNTVGFILISENSLSITELITFNTIVSFFVSPIKNLINNIPKYNFIRASFIKINEFMSLKKELTEDYTHLENFNLSFKNITFGYNDFYKVLDNFSLNIKYSDHILLKGKSGSGKSTVCKLLTGYESDYQGEIKIGNINIKDLSSYIMRKNIVYITQKEYLFSETLKNNIVFFSEFDLQKFNEICQICCIDEIIKKKKMRYDSYIEPDSNNFSGGEKQRIILARACLNDFNILIIDEALSEVDILTERKIIDNLRKYFKEKAIIYISHKKLDDKFNKVVHIGR